MLDRYKLVYRNYGIRMPSQMVNPPVGDFGNFFLPQLSIFHYVANDESLSPSDNIYYLRSKEQKTPIITLDHYSNIIGHVREKNINVKTELSKLRQINRKFIYTTEFDIIPKTKRKTPVVINYGLLNKKYIYIPNPLNQYYKWYNTYNTVTDTITILPKYGNRRSYIFINVPDVIPSTTILKRHIKDITKRTLVDLDTPDKLLIHDIWMWINPETRYKSIFNKLKPRELENTVLVFIHNGQYTLLNMNRLFSFIKSDENSNGLPYTQVQKLFLSMLATIGYDSNSNTSNVVHNISDTEITNDDMDEIHIQSTDNDITDDNEKPEVDEIDDVLDKADEILDIIEKKSKEEDIIKAQSIPVVDNPEVLINEDIEDKNVVESLLDEYLKWGMITAKEYKDIKDTLSQQDNAPSPYDPDTPLGKFRQITEDMLVLKDDEISIPDSEVINDKTMLKSTLKALDKKYISQVLPRDMINTVYQIQKTGVIIQDYQVEKYTSIQGDYEIHRIKVKPIDGPASTVEMRIPSIKEDGTFTVGGIEYRMRKQRIDAPIRKIDYNRVGLTSYYGKLFVTRASMKKDDYYYWLYKQLLKLSGMDDSPISNVIPASSVVRYKNELPTIYTGMSRYVSSFKHTDVKFNFNYSTRLSIVNNDEELLNKLEKDGRVLAGKFKNGDLLIINKDNRLIRHTGGDETDIGTLEEYLSLDISKAPVEYSTLKVFNKSIPVVYMLLYYIGMDNLLKLLNAKPRIIEGNKRVDLQPHEYVIRFSDRKLVFDRRNKKEALIIAGFNAYKNSVKLYDYKEFNRRDVITSILDNNGITTYYIKEINLLDKLFIDPMTKTILEEMDEPTTFRGLLLRANELLMTDYSPDPQDMRYMLIKNYERIPGMVYKEMIKAIKNHQFKNTYVRTKFELDPYGVWKTMLQDSANVLVSDQNPIDYLKQLEDVTYTGVGGRSKDTINKETRAFHITDIGIFSEATKDSGDVGVSAYLSANPKLKSVRGLPGQFNFDTDGAASILSTSALLAPGATNDDPKRTNFISIQNKHVIPIAGQDTPYVRTGYEYVLPYRMDERFVTIAEQDGEVIKVNKKGILVKYKDGTVKGSKLGLHHTKTEGGTSYPHIIVTDLKEGDKFKKDDVIAYNSAFFGKDILVPNRILYKYGTTLRTAIYESTQTLEDSCAITTRAIPDLTSKVSKVKDYLVSFDNEIKDPVMPGDKLEPDTPMMYILDNVVANSPLFDKEALQALKDISSMAPKAKYKAIVDKVIVYYNGEVEDMSSGLKALVEYSDAELIRTNKAMNKPPITGRVDSEFRVEGKPLQENHALIRYYITIDEPMGVGDKGIFANQLKTTVGEIIDYPFETEDGKPVDAVFGYRSIMARIVLSPMLLGTTITLLKVIADRAVKLYKS